MSVGVMSYHFLKIAPKFGSTHNGVQKVLEKACY